MSQRLDIKYSYLGVPTCQEFAMDDSFIRGLMGPFGCTSGATEFLTPQGWKRIDQYEPGDMVAQWDQETNAITFVEPLAYVREPCAELIEFRGAIVMQLSPEHRVPHQNWAGRFQVKTAEEIERRPSRRTIPTTFNGHDDDALGMSDDMIRFAVMMHADGHYPKHGKQAVICVRRDRKKARFRALAERLKLDYSVAISDARPTEVRYTFYPPYLGKHYTGDWWKASKRELAIVLDEMRYWDGHDGEDLRFATTHKEDADFIQYAAHANGLRASVRSVAINDRNKDWATQWNVFIRSGDNAKNRACIREETEIKRIATVDGFKYCFAVQSTFWLARCEDTIFITGNSGKSSACVTELVNRGRAQRKGPDGVRRTRFAVIRNTYGELRDTTIKTIMQWLPELYFGRYVKHEHTYTITAFEDTVIELVFLALDRPDDIKKLLSLELTGAWVNEAREVPWSIIEALQGRVGRYPAMRDGGASWFGIWMDTNPPDNDSRWFKFFEEARPSNARIFKQPSGRARNAENLPNLPGGQRYYTNLAIGKKAEWIKVYVDGEYGFVVDGRPVFPEYNDRIHCQDVDPVPGVTIIRSWDFGLTPACAFSQVLPSGQWLTFDEMTSDGMSIDKFSDDVIQHCNRAFRGEGVRFEDWADPAGNQRAQTDLRTCFDIMQGKGIMVEGSIQNPQMRHESIGKPLRTLVDGEPQFILHSRCKNLRKGFMGGYHYRRLKVSGERYSDKVEKNMLSHIMEALEYGTVQYFAPVLTGQYVEDDYPDMSDSDYIGGDDGRSPYSGY